MEVVCDTNIWYGIANGKIDINLVPASTKLIATFTSLQEIGSSHKIYKSPLEAKRTAEVLLKHANYFELLSPLHYIKSREQRCKCSDSEKGKYYLTEIKKLASMPAPEIELLAKAKGNDLGDAVEGYKGPITGVTRFVNEDLMPDVRDSIKKTTAKNEHRKKDFSEIRRALMRQWVELGIDYTLSDNYAWGEIELMMRVLGEFFLEIELSKRKIKENDWADCIFQSKSASDSIPKQPPNTVNAATDSI